LKNRLPASARPAVSLDPAAWGLAATHGPWDRQPRTLFDPVKLWEARAFVHVNRKLGYMLGAIERRGHGDKTHRAYINRWDMFIKLQFYPHADVKRNTYGVLEFSGNKPDLERRFDNYLLDREEDSNIIG
jgi:hypothetical protein